MKIGGAALGCLGATALLAASCQLLVGLEERTERASDAGPAVIDGEAPIDPCSVVGTPARPNMPDDDGGGDFVFALERIDVGLDGGLPFSLNLDRTCTCPAADSCIRPDAGGSKCDGDGGSDNATSAALEVLTIARVFSEESLNQNLRSGTSGALLRLQRYSGLPDDPSVIASFYGAIAFDGPRPTGRPEDRWIVDEAALEEPKAEYRARYFDANAYVSSGTLVATFDFPLEVGGNERQAPLRLDFRAGVIVARVDVTTGKVRGVLAGRWPTASIFSTLATLPDPLAPGEYVCPGTSSYRALRDLVCGARDIVRDPLLDHTGASCDALSAIIGFEGSRAQLGGFGIRPRAPGGCEAGVAVYCDD